METVYVVSIPWDGHMVKYTKVFKEEKDAQEYCIKMNEKGYNGYCGGLFVQHCEINLPIDTD